jgi:hypothetical protein
MSIRIARNSPWTNNDYCPVPDRFTTCGLLPALSVNVNVPVAGPETVGPNVTRTVQFAPAATVPQVLDATANPVLASTLLTVRLVLMRFVKVTVLAKLVVPTVAVPKFNELGESVT